MGTTVSKNKKMDSKVWRRRTTLTWHRTIGCGCQQSVTPFDRWIRALLASTELKADGHMTGGLVLTQLKEGGRLGAYHHMPPYLFPLGVVPFHFHSQFSCCLSILPCDFNHKALEWRCACFISNPIFPFICSFLRKRKRVSLRHNQSRMGLNPLDSCPTQIETNATISPPSALRQNILLSCSREAVTHSIFSWAVLNSPPSGRRDHSIEERMLYWQHMALGKTVAVVFLGPLLPLLLWHPGTQHAGQFQPETTSFLHKPGKILPFSSTARWAGAEVTSGAPRCSPTRVNAEGVWVFNRMGVCVQIWPIRKKEGRPEKSLLQWMSII